MRNGILYRINEIQEVNWTDRNTMELVLHKALKKTDTTGLS